MEKHYKIEGQSYIQRPIMLGQLRALLPILEDVEVGANMGPLAIMSRLGNRLHEALAIVLIEEGLGVREALDKLEERARELECLISPEQALEAIEDFFECNPASSLVSKIGGMLGKLRAGMIEPILKTISKGSSSSSPEETSAKESKSSGKSRPDPPSSGSGTRMRKRPTKRSGS